MRPFDGHEHGNITNEHIPETGATSCSTFTQHLMIQTFSHHHHAELTLSLSDGQMDEMHFLTAFHLLTNHRQNQTLMDFNLENKIEKLACVRTKSKDRPPFL